jgi:hypothetical protein
VVRPQRLAVLQHAHRLAGLVLRAHIVGAAEVVPLPLLMLPAVVDDEHAREGEATVQEAAELVLEGGVHGHVALVHRHAIGPQYGVHGAAVLEGCARRGGW